MIDLVIDEKRFYHSIDVCVSIRADSDLHFSGIKSHGSDQPSSHEQREAHDRADRKIIDCHGNFDGYSQRAVEIFCRLEAFFLFFLCCVLRP